MYASCSTKRGDDQLRLLPASIPEECAANESLYSVKELPISGQEFNISIFEAGQSAPSCWGDHRSFSRCCHGDQMNPNGCWRHNFALEYSRCCVFGTAHERECARIARSSDALARSHDVRLTNLAKFDDHDVVRQCCQIKKVAEVCWANQDLQAIMGRCCFPSLPSYFGDLAPAWVKQYIDRDLREAATATRQTSTACEDEGEADDMVDALTYEIRGRTLSLRSSSGPFGNFDQMHSALSEAVPDY